MADKGGIFGLLKQTFKDFSDDGCPTMAAALSYYTVFALPPLLLLIIMIVGAVMDPQTVRDALQGQMGNLLGESGGQEIQTIIQKAQETKAPNSGRPLAAILSIAALIFGATGAFGQLQQALNRAWEVAPDPEQGGLKNFILKRVLSFGMILGIAFLLMVSLALSAVISAIGGALALSEPLLHLFNFLVSVVVFTLLFAAMFKILPDAKVGWGDVWVGAIFTTLLFVIGKFAIGFYLGRSNPGEAFGAAGSLAILLIWIYYASMILLLGAEFTQKWAERRGGGIVPEEGAVRVVEETRHVRGLGAASGTGEAHG
jgi:membrane protein